MFVYCLIAVALLVVALTAWNLLRDKMKKAKVLLLIDEDTWALRECDYSPTAHCLKLEGGAFDLSNYKTPKVKIDFLFIEIWVPLLFLHKNIPSPIEFQTKPILDTAPDGLAVLMPKFDAAVPEGKENIQLAQFKHIAASTTPTDINGLLESNDIAEVNKDPSPSLTTTTLLYLGLGAALMGCLLLATKWGCTKCG